MSHPDTTNQQIHAALTRLRLVYPLDRPGSDLNHGEAEQAASQTAPGASG